MQTKENILKNLKLAFVEVGLFIQGLNSEDLHRNQGNKWTIAEELGHLTVSTKGTAFLYGLSLDKHRLSLNTSRVYDEIVRIYLDKLQSNPLINNTTVLPSEEIQKASPDSMKAQWQKCTEDCLNTLQTWQEEDMDKYTVWKHPLIGILTAREMAFFTVYHTRHHLKIMREKKNKEQK